MINFDRGLASGAALLGVGAAVSFVVAPLLAPLNLSRRRVIELRNPLLPASAPVNRRELWWRP
jgi:hypothetical protein